MLLLELDRRRLRLVRRVAALAHGARERAEAREANQVHASRRGLQLVSPATPYAILDRLTSSKMGDLNSVLGKWGDAFIIPPKQSQAFNQGGLFVFDGDDSVFVHYDASTGAHGDLDRAVAVALARA